MRALPSGLVSHKSKPVPGHEGVFVRNATNADGDALRKLVFGVLEEHGLQPDPCGTDADLGNLEAAYAKGCMNVLEAGGVVIGSAALLPHDAGTMELRKLYLAEPWRGRGLGKFLIEHALAQAHARGARRVVLETAAALENANRLYARFGFRPSTHAPATPRADRAMELDLPPAVPSCQGRAGELSA